MKLLRRARFSALAALLAMCLELPLASAETQRASSPSAQNEVGQLTMEFGRLIEQKRYGEAIPVGKRLVDASERAVGTKHQDYATALLLLGAAYRMKEDYRQAGPVFRRALDIYQRLYGPDDLRVARAVLNIGVVADKTGDSKGALAAYQRVLAIHEKVYGPDSPKLEPALNTLESYYFQRKQYAAAEPLYLKDLAIRSKANGPASDEASQVLVQLATLSELRQDFDRQRRYLERALANVETTHGKGSVQAAAMLTRLGLNAAARNDTQGGISIYQRALAIYEAPPTANHSDAALCSNALAQFYSELGDFARARPLYERALRHDEQAGDQHGVAINLLNLGTLASKRGNPARARDLIQRALSQFETLDGPESADVGRALDGLASTYFEEGDYARAQALYERALRIAEKGKDQLELVRALNALARAQSARAEYTRAEAGFQRARHILETSGMLDTKDGAMVLGNLAANYQDQGNYAAARPLYERALQISEKAHAPGDPARAHAWNNRGDLSKEMGKYEAAEADYRRALDIWTRAFGQEHPLVSLALNNLGALYQAKGGYGKAIEYFERSLEIVRKTRPAGHPDIATTWNNLANVYEDQGEWERAGTLQEQALASFEKALPKDHPLLGLALNNLGAHYVRHGDAKRGAPLLGRALSIAKAHEDRRAAARTQLNLAHMYDAANDLGHAEPLWREALASLEAELGKDHPNLGPALLGLGSVLVTRGRTADAERVVRRALKIAERAEGAGGPNVARCRGSLAFILGEQHRYEEAQELYAQTERMLRDNFGDAHADLAQILVGRALLHWEAGNRAQAVAAMNDGLQVRERGLSKLLASGSEEQRRLLLETSSGDLHWAVSLYAQGFPGDAGARQQALLAVLQRKGRVLDAMTDTTRTMRQHLDSQAQQLFEGLRTIRSQIANRSMAMPTAGPGSEAALRVLRGLERDAEQTEAALSKRSSLFAFAAKPVSVQRIARAIPAGAALIEIVGYLPFDPRASGMKGWGARRYAAFVLRGDGNTAYVDLGDSQSLDALATDFKRQLADPHSDPKALAKALDQRLLQPLRPHLSGARQLVFAPDGALSVIPFGALRSPQDHYLIEDVVVSYVSTGRELLRPAGVKARNAALVVASPDFGPLPTAGKRGSMTFPPLLGTQQEGRAVAATLPGARLLAGAAATTHAIESQQSPRLLHLATHGFFLDDSPSPPPSARGVFLTQREVLAPQPQNPLLRSGLALAGANLRHPNDDGLLSALEASSLDLWGTQLVVLSACDTGLGIVKNGEGVYGLRRAFTLAGAESLVMSLWSVQDAATRDLMIRFYQHLAKGEGRAEALRRTQLEMLKKDDLSHPFYWASFVQYGKSSPL